MENKKFLEIEAKYDASEIDRIEFKSLMKSMGAKSLLYIEGKDIYYVKGDNEFLRYRMPINNGTDRRAELTFKKKSVNRNNNIREEVNLRVDLNSPELVEAFCEGLGYSRNFSIEKWADIYYFDDANIVHYYVFPESGKMATYLEVEAAEDIGLTEKEAWEVVQKYEKLLAPIGINPQKRKKLSLFEMYRK